ncbi:hypothetical protein NG2371_00961 [Nocardia gamkensis]|nr:hypothetical protein [Nocardia gamkensis]
MVVEQVGLLALGADQQIAHGLRRVEAHPHRHGVDEQTDHRLHAGQLGGTPGDGGAEQHVVAAGHPADEHAPRRLQHGVRGDAERAGQRGQPRGGRLVQLEEVLAGQRGDLATGVRPRQQGRFADTAQRVRPRGQRRLMVLLPGPVQEVPVGAHGGQRGSIRVHGVEHQQIPHEQRHRPAVEQDVVVGHHELPAVGRDLDQREADQRRCGQVEPPHAVGLDQVVGRTGFDPVVLGPRDAHAVQHDLHRVAVVVADERGAQVLVAVHQCLCGSAQPGGVHPAGERQHRLGGVHVHRARREAGVEQQTGL